MRKTEETTFGLASAANLLGLERNDLLFFVAAESRPLGRLPFIPDSGCPDRIRFTWRNIETIQKKLKNYKPEPLDFEAVERVFEKI